MDDNYRRKALAKIRIAGKELGLSETEYSIPDSLLWPFL